ncbi:MAG: hypothetical protein K9H58_18960 [Bacteroidales bacterium]|nr:hypothetical protein [Bacteroidales bacterium]
MESIDKYFWIIIIGVIGINILIFRSRARTYLDDKPDIKEKTNILFWNVFIFTSLPFLIQGIGILTGNIDSVFDYLKPENANTFIILWYVSLFLMWTKGTLWIFNRNGAEFLSEHPEVLLKNMFRFKKSFSPKIVKIGWIAFLILGIWGILNPYMIGL